MANKDCGACNDLNSVAPTLAISGLDDTMCTSLQNNTGLNPSSGHNDCDDLNDLNDCLIGNLDQELNAYEVCDWKTFMHKLLPNLWTNLKAIICAICGIWKQFDKIWCWLENLSKPQKNDTLTPDDDKVRYRAVDGVTSRYDPQHPVASDAPLRIQVIGGIAKITGSLHLEGNMPNDYTSGGNTGRVPWLNFFKGQTNVVNRYNRSSYDGNCPSGGFLLYEYEVKACDWGFKKGYDAPLHPSSAGDFICRIMFYEEGDEYPYDCGWKLEDGKNAGQTYTPTSSKYDTLIQVRLMYVNSWGIAHENGNITPNGVAMVKPCTDSWDC